MGQEVLPEGREGLGGPPEGTGRVRRPFQWVWSGPESLSGGQVVLGGSPGGPRGVRRPSLRVGSSQNAPGS